MSVKGSTFCTILTRNYLPFAAVLFQSLVKTNSAVQLQVLVADAESRQDLYFPSSQLTYHDKTSILTSDIAKSIYKKYAATNNNQLRWSLKPVFILHLLQSGFEKVIYVDPDVYFTGDYRFLFEELNKYDILLSPHWSIVDPLKHEDGLYSILRNGLYSGCFVGSTKNGTNGLQWWAEACHYKVEKVKELGLYDDQKYLDVLPLINEKTGLIRHPGCNITNINIDSCKRELVNGQMMINHIFHPIFIHFTKDTIINIRNGNDRLLQPYLNEYTSALKNAGADLMMGTDVPSTFFYKIKRNLLLRTRLKRFFFKLVEKL